MGMYGGCDFFDLKGHVQGLLEDLGIKKITFETESENLSYHPGRCARVLINGETLGVMGQVHPSVAEEFKIDAEIYCAELDFNTLLKHATFDRKYKVLPKFPASSRDIALVIDNSISVGEIEKIIGRNRANILESFKLFDVYAGEQVGKNKKSVAYSLTFRAADRTLTDGEINQVVDKILAELKENLNAELR